MAHNNLSEVTSQHGKWPPSNNNDNDKRLFSYKKYDRIKSSDVESKHWLPFAPLWRHVNFMKSCKVAIFSNTSPVSKILIFERFWLKIWGLKRPDIGQFDFFSSRTLRHTIIKVAKWGAIIFWKFWKFRSCSVWCPKLVKFLMFAPVTKRDEDADTWVGPICQA